MGLSLDWRRPGPHNLMSMSAPHNDRWTLKGNPSTGAVVTGAKKAYPFFKMGKEMRARLNWAL